jgi:hypothetical protein
MTFAATRSLAGGETKRLCSGVEAGTTVVSDGGQWLRCIAEQPGIVHERHVTDSDRRAARHRGENSAHRGGEAEWLAALEAWCFQANARARRFTKPRLPSHPLFRTAPRTKSGWPTSVGRADQPERSLAWAASRGVHVS